MVKNLPDSAGSIGDAGSIPGSGRSSGEGNGNLIQDSSLENPMNRGAWRASVHGVAESDLTERPSTRARRGCSGRWERQVQRAEVRGPGCKEAPEER